MVKMISIVRRCGSFARNQSKENENVHHVFEKAFATNLQELKELFMNNVIRNENGLILLNKPSGLRKELSDKISPKKKITLMPAAENINHLSFEAVLPLLSRELNIPNLQLVKAPERYISGVSILSSSNYTRARIKKVFGNVSLPISTYLAICIGIPFKRSDRVKLGLTLREKNDVKKAVLLEKYSRKSVNSHQVVPVVMRHDTLAVNESLNVSLIRIQNNRNKWHALRAYCGLRLLSPVLGDSYYSSCVRTLGGKAVLIDPLSPLANFPAKLPSKLLSALELRPSEKAIIPPHLHLSGVNLPKFAQGKMFVAKLPDHFLWTCQKLDLHVPEVYLQNGVVDEEEFHFVTTRNETKIVNS